MHTVWRRAWVMGLACLAVTGCVDPGPYGGGYAGEYPAGYGGGYVGGGYGGGGPVIIDRGPAAVVVQERGGPGYYGRGGYDRGYDRGYNRGYERERDRDRQRAEQRRDQERRVERREERREVRPDRGNYNPMRAVQERDRRAQEELYRQQGR